jgi:hypothetical protein
MSRPAKHSLWLRFWAKVDVAAGAGGCWIWVGAITHGRRGRRCGHIRVGKTWWKAHRLVLTWAKGPSPEAGMEAGHRCPGGANALCVNPLHLEWVTRAQNEADKRAAA